MEEIPDRRRHSWVCEHLMMALVLIYRVSAAEKIHEHTLPGGAKCDAKKFGRLKVALEEIPTLFSDRTVRSHTLLLGTAL